jgi:hypothetical protein
MIHDSYLCKCEVPKPVIYLGEDTGLCLFCRFIYDPNLYERRLRQHVKDFGEGDLHDFLMRADPNYARLNV